MKTTMQTLALPLTFLVLCAVAALTHGQPASDPDALYEDARDLHQRIDKARAYYYATGDERHAQFVRIATLSDVLRGMLDDARADIETPTDPVVITPEIPDDVTTIHVGTGGDVSTPEEAYDQLTEGEPARVLLKRGETFSLIDDTNDSFRRWWKSGESKQRPIIVGAYGEGPDPIILTNGKDGLHVGRGKPGPVEFVEFRNLHFIANHRKPDHPDFDGAGRSEGGIVLRSNVRHVTFDGLTVEYFFNNLWMRGTTERIEDVTIRNSTFRRNWTPGAGHTQNAFIENVDGLTLENNLFEHSGWLPGKPETRNAFRHQLYFMGISDLRIVGNTFRHGSYGAIKIRADQVGGATDLVIRDNTIHDLLPIEIKANATAERGTLYRDVLIEGNTLIVADDPLPNGTGAGSAVWANSGEGIVAKGNRIYRLAGNGAAVMLGVEDRGNEVVVVEGLDELWEVIE